MYEIDVIGRCRNRCCGNLKEDGGMEVGPGGIFLTFGDHDYMGGYGALSTDLEGNFGAAGTGVADGATGGGGLGSCALCCLSGMFMKSGYGVGSGSEDVNEWGYGRFVDLRSI